MHTTLPDGNQYGDVDGTYASAALATGIVSLLQAAEGDLTPDNITHILEKTAIPIGPPGYGDQSGFGIIDAGAAMDFVDNYDIKHGTATNGQVEEIFTGEPITFYSNSIWGNFAAGAYIADKYKVTYTIPLVPSSDNDLWYNAGSTLGLSGANPNDQNRYANVEMFSNHAEVTMFTYKLYTTSGQDLGWHPASPENAHLSYSYVGEIAPPPLSVYISGIRVISSSGNYTWEAEVDGGDGNYNYQWQWQQSSGSSWTNVGTGQSYTRFLTRTDQAQYPRLRVIVTSGSQQKTSTALITIPGEDCPPDQICPEGQ